MSFFDQMATSMKTNLSRYMAFCALNFGYDVGTFAGVQAMQSFTKEFGVYNEKRKLYMLPSWLASVMVATPFLGKALVFYPLHWEIFTNTARELSAVDGLLRNGEDELQSFGFVFPRWSVSFFKCLLKQPHSSPSAELSRLYKPAWRSW